MRPFKCFLGLIPIILSLSSFSYAQLPSFVAQTPITGNSGNAFYVFLPLANVGKGNATNIMLTSVALTHLGSAAAKLLQPSALPYSVGFAAPTGVNWLDLEFDNSKLVNGDTYLLKLSGTYEANGTKLDFSIHLNVVYESGGTSLHIQVLDAITKKFQSLPRIDRLSDSQVVLAFIQGMPEISATNFNTSTVTIWAQFADDGETFLVMNHPLPSPPVLNGASAKSTLPANTEPSLNPPVSDSAFRAQSTVTSATELPFGAARLLNGLAAGFDNTLPDLSAWLAANGYQLVPGTVASVDALRTVGGDGVLYIQSHGGADDNDNFPYNVYTTTPVVLELDALRLKDPTLYDDYVNHRVVVGQADDHYDPTTQKWIRATHYGITQAFVDKYWGNFAPNAFVYISGCEGDLNTPSPQAFKQEILQTKQASVYAAWTNDVYDDNRAATARLIFDRLLGANQFCPEVSPYAVTTPCVSGSAPSGIFPQRPFDWTAVKTDFPLHTLGTDLTTGAVLTFTANPTTVFGLLAPSIEDVAPDDILTTPQLLLRGSFGSDTGTVTVDGTAVAVSTWTPTVVVTDLPLTLSGDVVVTVRGHKSNAARLTRWEGDFTAKTIGIGSLKQNLDFHLAFRSDVRQFRPQIHFPPVDPAFVSAIYALPNASKGSFSCSGTGSTTSGNSTTTYTWQGSQSLVAEDQANGGPPNSFVLIAGFLNSRTQLTVTELGGMSSTPCAQQAVTVSPGGTTTSNTNIEICFNAPQFTVPLNAQTADIRAGSQAVNGNTCGWPTGFSQGTLKWPNITATSPPDPSSAR